MNTKCPICNEYIKGHYCPICGLPATICGPVACVNCGNLRPSYYYRPGISGREHNHWCNKCHTPNPLGAKYCRNCGKKMHEWVDLGLSVLWSTETLEGFYGWKHSEAIDRLHPAYNNFKRDNIDVATKKWGEEWRIPTKEEFEELIIKCKWEKCLDTISKNNALKVIGPNGNSIIIPVVTKKDYGSSICLWTSTEDAKRSERAYAFRFKQEMNKTLNSTCNNIKKNPYHNTSFLEQLVKLQLGNNNAAKALNTPNDNSSNIAFCKFNEDNINKDEDKWTCLWLETPVEMHYNEERIRWNTITPVLKDISYAIRPVADKKWKGKL